MNGSGHEIVTGHVQVLMQSLKAQWRRIIAPALPRSSHSLSVIKNCIYIFGGEIQPRKPVDNAIHVFSLSPGTDSEQKGGYDNYVVLPARGARVEGSHEGDVPAPRVGHTAAAVGECIYVFAGRGGKDMQPLVENGRVWVFDTRTTRWSFLDPPQDSPFPAARSYHCSASTITREDTHSGDDESGTVYVHGGCPAHGRLADVWAFCIAQRRWTRLPDAPPPPRGGSALACALGRLWRFGGYDGTTELGGRIDVLPIGDGSGGEQWASMSFSDARTCPGARSVAGLQRVVLPASDEQGKQKEGLVVLFGERGASSIGHDGAGKFWDDVWVLPLEEGNLTLGGDPKWIRVEIANSVEAEDRPQARGWIASTEGGHAKAESVVVWGGLNDQNERLGDGWLLTFHK